MTNPCDSAPQSPAKSPGGRWLYPVLLTLETTGAVMLYREGLPIYRETLADPSAYDPEANALALAACVLIQVAYWIRYRIRPERARVVNVVLGHIVLFLSGLIFLLPTAVFSYLFIAKTVEVQIPASKCLFIVFALFSLFCYVLELERLGGRLLGRADK